MGLRGNTENKCTWGWTVLLSKKEKRREEKEKENFQNKSQSWELPEKVILLPGRANHGVMPVLSLGSTAARVGRDLPQPSSPPALLLSGPGWSQISAPSSAQSPLLHPLQFSSLWVMSPQCSFPQDRVSAAQEVAQKGEVGRELPSALEKVFFCWASAPTGKMEI